MTRDFTLDAYVQFLRAAQEAGYDLVSFADYVRDAHRADRVVVLRHDVDRRPGRALAKARLEASVGAEATYFFRIVPESWDEDTMRAIAGLGHEIGYHYEDLTLARGDLARAADLFTEHLARFRTVWPVETICMHGSPLSRWDNRALFDRVDYREHGILAEPYFDLDFDRIFYLTDTGRRWDGASVGVRDKVETAFEHSFHTTFEIVEALRSGDLPAHVMVNTHPERWLDSLGAWTRELGVQQAKNAVKWGLVRLGHGRTGSGRTAAPAVGA